MILRSSRDRAETSESSSSGRQVLEMADEEACGSAGHLPERKGGAPRPRGAEHAARPVPCGRHGAASSITASGLPFRRHCTKSAWKRSDSAHSKSRQFRLGHEELLDLGAGGHLQMRRLCDAGNDRDSCRPAGPRIFLRLGVNRELEEHAVVGRFPQSRRSDCRDRAWAITKGCRRCNRGARSDVSTVERRERY